MTKEDIQKLLSERDEYKKLYLMFREENERLKRGLSGKGREMAPPDVQQLSLQMIGLNMTGQDAPSDDAAEEPASTDIAPHKRRKPTGRKPLPEELPRVEFELLPEEVKQKGLEQFTRVGEEVSEVLEHRPASTVVVRVVRPKFVPKGSAELEHVQFQIAPTPDLPIDRGLAGPGFLADTIVRRWQDHCPLHRMEAIFARDGLPLAKSTICTWHISLAALALPLIGAMKADAFEQPYLMTDATGVLVQAPEKCKHTHFWVLVAPEKHVLFEHSESHNSEAVDKLLEGYAGYLVADAHVVYDHLYTERGGGITEVGCWAHCRRYFFKALGTDPERARKALAKIGALFKLEKQLVKAGRKEKEKMRRKRAAPIVNKLFGWLDEQALVVLDGSPISDAVRYARNQRAALERYLTDGRLPMHNNPSELQLRRQAIGRKNWLFIGSEDGAVANTVFVSLLASCQMHGLHPWQYLRDLLCLLPTWPRRRVLQLAPAYWRQTMQRPDVQAQLEANGFRRATMRRDLHAPNMPEGGATSPDAVG